MADYTAAVPPLHKYPLYFGVYLGKGYSEKNAMKEKTRPVVEASPENHS